MGCFVGLMCYFFDMKIISLLEKKRIQPDFSDPEVNQDDIYKFDPPNLPERSERVSDEQGWYFFCEPYYKYAKSERVNRQTPGGYWTITGGGSDLRNKKGQVIGSKKILVFYLGDSSSGVKTDWVMHEFYVKDKNDPRYTKDFVLCFIERKPKKSTNKKKKSNKSALSTPDDGQPRNSLSSVSVSQVAEYPYIEVKSKKRKSNKSAFSTPDDGQPRNSLSSVSISQVAECPYIEVKSQQPSSSHRLSSDPGENITEISFSEVEPQPLQNANLVRDSGSLFPESTNSLQVDPQPLAELYSTDSSYRLNQSSLPTPQLPTNPEQHRLSSDPGENITEISFSEVELQLLQTANLARDPESLVRESTTSLVELQLPVNNNSCPMQVDPQLLDELDSTDSCYRWNQSPVPALQLPINPDHNEGFDPCTDSTGFKDGYNVSGFQFDAISLRDFEYFHPCEVTEHSPVCEDIDTISKTQWTGNHIDDELEYGISLCDFIDDELEYGISLWDFENEHPCEVTEHSPVCEDIETISKTPVDCKPH